MFWMGARAGSGVGKDVTLTQTATGGIASSAGGDWCCWSNASQRLRLKEEEGGGESCREMKKVLEATIGFRDQKVDRYGADTDIYNEF